MTDATPRLWEFSLTLYGQPAVEPLCLHLQNHWGANVNILLWARWLEARNIELNQQRIQQAQTQLHDWDQEVLQPLRTLRQQVKKQFASDAQRVETTRQAIRAAELEAEKVELKWLEELTNDWAHSGGKLKSGSNLACYLDSLHIPDEDIRASVKVFIAVEALGA